MSTKKNRFDQNLPSDSKKTSKLFRGPEKVWKRLAALKKAQKAKSINAMLIAVITTVCDEEGIPQ